jgi:hypothetical protein
LKEARTRRGAVRTFVLFVVVASPSGVAGRDGGRQPAPGACAATAAWPARARRAGAAQAALRPDRLAARQTRISGQIALESLLSGAPRRRFRAPTDVSAPPRRRRSRTATRRRASAARSRAQARPAADAARDTHTHFLRFRPLASPLPPAPRLPAKRSRRHAPRRWRTAADARRCRAAPFPAAAGGDALADSSGGDVSFDDVLPAAQQAATAAVEEEGDSQVRRARGRVRAEGRTPQR